MRDMTRGTNELVRHFETSADGRRAVPWAVAAAFGTAYLGYRVLKVIATPRDAGDGTTFRERTVVITGGSRGLGLALARRFAAERANLVLLARSADQLQSAAESLRAAFGVRVMPIVCDLRDEQAVGSAVAEVIATMGRIDVLVNNAGIIQVMPFEHAQDEDYRDSLATHFWGPYYMIRACLPYLSSSGGRVVNIASIGGRVAVPHLSPYGVGKFALVGFSEGLHAELASHGVSVTTVTPHLMMTGSHRNVLVRGKHALEATWFALGTSTRLTALDPEDVAKSIVEATRQRRASLTPGWQARLATVVNALFPGATGAVAASVGAVLPSSTSDPRGDDAVPSRDVNLHGVSWLFPTDAARNLNQDLAPDEA